MMPLFDTEDFSESVGRVQRAAMLAARRAHPRTLRESIAALGPQVVAHHQADAWHTLHLAVATDPALRAELERIREARRP